MGELERDILETQHQVILGKIATAEGAFRATGYLGGALIVIAVAIFVYAFDKLEVHDIKISNHESRISVIESQVNKVGYKE